VYVRRRDGKINASLQPEYKCSDKPYGFILEKKASATFMNMNQRFL